MEPNHIFIVAVAGIITSGVTISTLAMAWLESRKHKGPAQPPRLDAIEARLARMEEAIESVAVEMERVAEGQRFTARVLAERSSPTSTHPAARPQPHDPRYVTPH